jgi:hypothetical protein
MKQDDVMNLIAETERWRHGATFDFRPASATEEAVLIVRTRTNTGGELIRSKRGNEAERLWREIERIRDQFEGPQVAW